MHNSMKSRIEDIVKKYKEDYVQDIKEVIEYMWKEIEPIVDEYSEQMDNSVTWCIHDIKHAAEESYGFKISDQDAQTVLEDIIHNHDASQGINWQVINEYVYQYKPHDPAEEYNSTSNESLFSQLVGANIIAPDEKYEEWADSRERMIELLIQSV